MKCAAHPEVETNLTCGKCGTPICPKCLVQTPVGARCSECASLKRLPTYEITPLQYLKAVGGGSVSAIILGIAWTFLWELIPIYFLNLLLAAGVGYALGEIISFSVNRKRGIGLQAIGGFCVALSYAVVKLSPWGIVFGFYDLLLLAVGIFVVVSRLR